MNVTNLALQRLQRTSDGLLVLFRQITETATQKLRTLPHAIRNALPLDRLIGAAQSPRRLWLRLPEVARSALQAFLQLAQPLLQTFFVSQELGRRRLRLLSGPIHRIGQLALLLRQLLGLLRQLLHRLLILLAGAACQHVLRLLQTLQSALLGALLALLTLLALLAALLARLSRLSLLTTLHIARRLLQLLARVIQIARPALARKLIELARQLFGVALQPLLLPTLGCRLLLVAPLLFQLLLTARQLLQTP